MADTETRSWLPARERVLWLSAALSLVVLPHVLRIPAWLSLSFLLLVSWRLGNAIRGIPLPPPWIRFMFLAATVSGVYVTQGSLFGLNAGVALLVVLAGMKLLEIRSLRDAYVLYFLGFFLVITNFLFSQSLLTGAYMFVVVLVLTATLVAINMPTGTMPKSRMFLLASSMVAQSLPIMLVLFVFFPRMAGPLWGLPEDAHSAVTGLSDTMSPGNISRLSRSDAVAFRVQFQGTPPPPAKLYWRGPVLQVTDGQTWTSETPKTWNQQPRWEVAGQAVEYSITLEPHFQRWLFALDIPVSLPPNAAVTDDLQLRAHRDIEERLKYRIKSYLDYRLTHFGNTTREQLTRLPPYAHPKTRALGRRWRAESATAQEIAAKAMAYFRAQSFFYTLAPPRLEGDTVDEFMFVTRRGFCEHYAAAFTVLMRAAGVPARVVTGYQGGEMNPLGDYMIVRQRDAHAWVEIWLEERGWTRIDPTAAVSPARIELGMDSAIPPATGLSALGLTSSSALHQFWRTVRYGWDSVNNAWNQRVLGYGTRSQREFLARFGLDVDNLWNVALGLVLGSGAMLLVVAVRLFRRAPTDDPVSRAYRRFCRKLSRVGLYRGRAEGPLDYARRVCRSRPELIEPVEKITELYVALRYGREERQEQGPGAEKPTRSQRTRRRLALKELQRLAWTFRP